MSVRDTQVINSVATALEANPRGFRYIDRMRIESSVFRLLQRLISKHTTYRFRGFSPDSRLEVAELLQDVSSHPWAVLVKRGCELVTVAQRLSIGSPYDIDSLDDLHFGGKEGLVKQLAVGLRKFADHISDELADCESSA